MQAILKPYHAEKTAADIIDSFVKKTEKSLSLTAVGLP